MDSNERQKAAVKVLIMLEPSIAHSISCPAPKNPAKCNCNLMENASIRAEALDNAGLLMLPKA